MEVTRAVSRLMALVCAAMIAMFACVGTAFASTVHGADFHGAGSALESGEVDVLNVDGSAGETVFLTVKHGSDVLAKNLPYTIGENANASNGASWAGVATLDIANLNLAQLDGSYTISAYANRAGGEPLYEGALYGVYADLPDGSSKLIGTRTANEAEAARDFQPAETLYSGGRTYRLIGAAKNEGGVLHFTYEPYDEAKTVDGVVKYLDAKGATIASTKIPGLVNGEERTVEIPSAVKGDDGGLYRTVFFQKSVKAVNPGQTSFSVYCTKMSDADQALAGFYVATIQMVKEDGTVIATDSVNVTGNFVYTAPSVIYKTEANVATGDSAVVTYNIAQSPTIRLSAANDGVLNRMRTIQVGYTTQAAEPAETKVVFNRIDGSKRATGEEAVQRNLGTESAVVTKDAPTAEPATEFEANGTKYHLVGNPADYAYTLGSGAVPSVDVYYTPEGYTPDGAYDVTVNYVNYSTSSLIESHTYTTDPNQESRITIDTPAAFSADGVNYVKLAGQEDAIQHSYYSNIKSYTVYYRDENDELSSGVVINRIRTVYEEGPTTVTAVSGTEAGGTTETVDAATGGDAGADATGADADAAADAQALQLNNSRTYNVMDGENGNATLTNESGVDSNTERIEDSDTPLASGFDTGASSSAATSFVSIGQLAMPLGIALVVIIIAIVALVFIRRRNRDEEYDL